MQLLEELVTAESTLNTEGERIAFRLFSLAGFEVWKITAAEDGIRVYDFDIRLLGRTWFKVEVKDIESEAAIASGGEKLRDNFINLARKAANQLPAGPDVPRVLVITSRFDFDPTALVESITGRKDDAWVDERRANASYWDKLESMDCVVAVPPDRTRKLGIGPFNDWRKLRPGASAVFRNLWFACGKENERRGIPGVTVPAASAAFPDSSTDTFEWVQIGPGWHDEHTRLLEAITPTPADEIRARLEVHAVRFTGTQLDAALKEYSAPGVTAVPAGHYDANIASMPMTWTLTRLRNLRGE